MRARLLRDLHEAVNGRYRFDTPIEKAGLDEAGRTRRLRFEAWLDERARTTKPKNKAQLEEAKARFRLVAEKEAAATLVNRLVLIRHLEALGLSKPAVITGGWNSKGYREFREFAPALLGDETEGYQTLIQLLFDELALDLPGLFGDVGLTRLIPIPAATLRDVIERLDDPQLVSAWTDDTTLGWVYQYWNDPERERLDAKLNPKTKWGSGKIEPHEIASKTQMFTERYMVEWLLHNSLGLTWLCICKKHGWTPDCARVLDALDARRAEWRNMREAGAVALDALMPIEGELEEHWKFYVPQPIPDDAVEKAPDSIRTLKLLDPACGSGHFLVIGFDLLVGLYREEARHRGETIGDREIAESVLENNLFGVDIDPRAIQIAAAALFLKARSLARNSRPRQVNLVAPALSLGNLPPNDPALVELRREIKRETGIPEELTDKLVEALAGVDHLGTLLKVDAAVEQALRKHESETRGRTQGDIFNGFGPRETPVGIETARASVLERIEHFLSKHSTEGDLGLRFDGEQLAAGIRFLRIVNVRSFDIVVCNPPYSDTSLLSDPKPVRTEYPLGRANLYAAFMERSMELLRPGGIAALLTMRGWMTQLDPSLTALRRYMTHECDLRSLGDVDRGAFEAIPDEQVAGVLTIARRALPASDLSCVALQPTPQSDRSRDGGRTARKRAALLAQVGRHLFNPSSFDAIEGAPIVYLWSPEFLRRYSCTAKIGEVSPARATEGLYNNPRFTRRWHEVAPGEVTRTSPTGEVKRWVPFVNGSDGATWFEPLRLVADWGTYGMAPKVYKAHVTKTTTFSYANERFFFRERGVAFSSIGPSFSGRMALYSGIFGNMGRSVFSETPPLVLCLMNSNVGRSVLESLNPGVHFETGDVNRLPLFPIENADQIVAELKDAFLQHESRREGSVEFTRPAPSPWNSARDWAQSAVNRPANKTLSPYQPVEDPPAAADFVSFAVGVALGRFGANGEGILEQAPATALPRGILFLSLASQDDSLSSPACKSLHSAWVEHGAAVGEGNDLRSYLRKSFFSYHKDRYEKRPIYFPLSSTKKSFVAWISIHRWTDTTLKDLLADYLLPAQRSLEGERRDLTSAKATGEKSSRSRAERRFADVTKLLEELSQFIADVTAVAEKGPPPPDDTTPAREADTRYVMNLDDGVMVNSAALWVLLEAQWKDPKKWWKDLATAQKGKDYDWSRLAARYFPDRVATKCRVDPSLAVAHGSFWRLHPAKAYAWELRLQDEIREGFTIDEPDSDEARAQFLAEQADQAREIHQKETERRERKARKALGDEGTQTAIEGLDPAQDDALDEEAVSG